MLCRQGILTAWTNDSVSVGIAAGLAVGKTVGVLGGAWLPIGLGIARKPEGTARAQMLGMSVAAGVGLTVALSVSGPAFADSALTEAARLRLLAGSVVAGLVGFTILWIARRAPVTGSAARADAELENA